MGERGQSYMGLFGGYSVYHDTHSLHFLPLSAAQEVTAALWRVHERVMKRWPDLIVFAACPFERNFRLVDAKTGAVFSARILRGRLSLRGCCVPIESDVQHDGGESLLQWLETWMQHVEQGTYMMLPIRPESGERTTGISIFPQHGPLCSVAVTRGVEVTASAVYVVEGDGDWAYSIRFRLVGTSDARGFKTCQLLRRHWVIKGEDEDAEYIDGDGVIGYFPILNDDGWVADESSDPHGEYEQQGQHPPPFVYQSRSGNFPRSKQGTFSGEITFVPGTKLQPAGDSFRVRLPCFPLVVPDVKF